MRILVIGGGGREHALGWKLAQHGHDVYASPGNPGLAQIGTILDTADYAKAAESIRADVTVVGPEGPLVAGIVDQFRARALSIVGPSQAQARLEGSKIYAKQFMLKAGLPTARSFQAHDFETARHALGTFPLPVAVKADGLAAGKGVIIAITSEQAVAAIESLGPSVVIEEFLTGEEISFIALCDGKTALPFEVTQDHKAVYDNDLGPNTGGMGAYCDGRLIDEAMTSRILDTIIRPVVERTHFTGFLYAGLMLTTDGPKLLEFNVRLGDPETQPLMHRMQTDFAPVLSAAAHGELSQHRFEWRREPSVCVVLAAKGYPGQPRTGDPITGIDIAGTEVFQAGTCKGPAGLETSGGRVLGVTARGGTLQAAIANAYQAVDRIHFDGMHFRKDIGRKGLNRW